MDNNHREIRDCSDEQVTDMAMTSEPVRGWMIGWVAEIHLDDDNSPAGMTRQLMIAVATDTETVAARFPAELAEEFVNDILSQLGKGQA